MENKQDIVHDEDDKKDIEVLELESLSTEVDEVMQLKNQIEELRDKLLRTMAESENTRRRFEKMIEESRDYAITNFAKDMLSVMDNLSRSLQYNNSDIANQITNIVAGIEMTKGELESIFKKHGLENINPIIGENFDYNIHHAVSQIETNDYDPDKVVDTMQTGYKIRDRLLRPAIVKVSKKFVE